MCLVIDGRSDFNGLHSRRHDHEVQFYAFDILISDGEDIRTLPLSMRRTNLARLLARRANDIFVAPFEQGENGPDLFRHARLMGPEGMVQASGERLPRRTVPALDQGQETRSIRRGKLTDDDLDVIAGKHDQLEGRLQERYGYAKDQARKEIDNFVRSADLVSAKSPARAGLFTDQMGPITSRTMSMMMTRPRPRRRRGIIKSRRR